jgi:hypothetical protein
MQTTRKLQLSAAAVIANALAALSATSPTIALANPCEPKTVCVPGATCPSALATNYCQTIASPGCTVTAVTGCTYAPSPSCSHPPLFVNWRATCLYE